MDNYIRTGFLCAGLANIGGVLGASKAFTSPHVAPLDPTVMSNFGLAMIILWGLAYIATASHWRQMKWLVGVFCVEKIFYSANWIFWITANGDTMREIYNRDFMSGLFFSAYGVNDILFALFFGFCFLKASNPKT